MPVLDSLALEECMLRSLQLGSWINVDYKTQIYISLGPKLWQGPNMSYRSMIISFSRNHCSDLSQTVQVGTSALLHAVASTRIYIPTVSPIEKANFAQAL